MAATVSSSSSSYTGHLSNGDGAAASKAYKPTHPGLFEVQFAEGNYNSYLVALKAFPKDSIVAHMNSTTPSNVIRYSTVQVGEESHIELNSDLLYCNHSCTPSVRFDVSGPKDTWAARAERDIAAGEVLTFFYPSTEWNMSQPFTCNCSTPSCLGTISGAKHIAPKTLDTYYVNDHILRLKAAQSDEAKELALEALRRNKERRERGA